MSINRVGPIVLLLAFSAFLILHAYLGITVPFSRSFLIKHYPVWKKIIKSMTEVSSIATIKREIRQQRQHNHNRIWRIVEKGHYAEEL